MTMPAATPGGAEDGFTLLELLVSLAIVAILLVAQVAPFQRTIRSRDLAEASMERSSAARLTLTRIAEELAGAVPLKGEARSFRVEDRSLDLPASEVRFATTAARRVRAGPQDPVELISYHVERPPDGDSYDLVKAQLPSVAVDGTPPDEFTVLQGVAHFRVLVLPSRNQGWTSTWEGGPGGTRRDLPRAAEIELAVADGTPTPPVYRLRVTLPMGPDR